MKTLEITRGVLPDNVGVSPFTGIPYEELRPIEQLAIPRPYLNLCVRLDEDGNLSGNLQRRRVQSGIQFRHPERLFKIPDVLLQQADRLNATEYTDTVVLSLYDTDYRHLCSFTLAQLDQNSDLRLAVDELMDVIQTKDL